MKRLTDFKPIKSIALPQLGALDAAGLMVVVGPNSSGKSQLLQDLFHRLCGEPRNLVVAEGIEVRKPADLKIFIDLLLSEGYLEQYTDPSGKHQLRPLTTYIGTAQTASLIDVGQPDNWWRAYDGQDASKISRIEFLNYFGRFLVTALFLERRLSSFNAVNTFDHQTLPPPGDLQAFWVDQAARDGLLAEIRNTFAKSIWPDATRGNLLSLKVSDDPNSPSAEERLLPKLMDQYRSIETEGDGLKSYVATCISLLLGRRPVCLIDEPELCLHPPQAYSLGRFIGTFGVSADRATFVATHSSHVLRGVIQTADRLHIVRLTRQNRSFVAHLISSDLLKEILRKPSVRSETVLDGIFAQSVVVLEGDGDRSVYQAAYETLVKEFPLDVHFTSVGGIGGIADICRLYRKLKIPIVAIADLDLMADYEQLRRVVFELTDETTAERIVASAAGVSAQVKALPPTLTPQEVRRWLDEALSLDMNWAENDDKVLRGKLTDIAHELDRMRRIKRGGLANLPPQVATSARQLLEELRNIGLFLVPVGELEQWLGAHDIKASKRNKWAWASEAAAKVRELGPQDDDVWSFMRAVATFLSRLPP